jgi:hypothetical protein
MLTADLEEIRGFYASVVFENLLKNSSNTVATKLKIHNL